MKRTTDDLARWRSQQENMAKPFPYVFPQMPPRFRRFYIFARAAFLLELGAFALAGLCGAVLFPMIVLGAAGVAERPLPALLVTIFLGAAALCALSMLSIEISGAFWRCPCCGQRFPYRAPRRSSLDILKGKDCLQAMQGLHIPYVQTRFCPLIIPSVCPACRAKFFDMP